MQAVSLNYHNNYDQSSKELSPQRRNDEDKRKIKVLFIPRV